METAKGSVPSATTSFTLTSKTRKLVAIGKIDIPTAAIRREKPAHPSVTLVDGHLLRSLVASNHDGQRAISFARVQTTLTAGLGARGAIDSHASTCMRRILSHCPTDIVPSACDCTHMIARAIHCDALARTRAIAIDSAIAAGIAIDGLRATARTSWEVESHGGA
jgi:hypothetical protein